MRLRTQLIVAFLGCGIVPLVVLGAISFSTARSGMSGMEATARESLEKGPKSNSSPSGVEEATGRDLLRHPSQDVGQFLREPHHRRRFP